MILILSNPITYNHRGVPCGLGFPDQYTDVKSFLSWIQYTIAENAVRESLIEVI